MFTLTYLFSGGWLKLCIMLGKQINTVKVLIIIWIFSSAEFTGISQETCDKIDDCSCKKSNGKIINLREIDGGSKAA